MNLCHTDNSIIAHEPLKSRIKKRHLFICQMAKVAAVFFCKLLNLWFFFFKHRIIKDILQILIFFRYLLHGVSSLFLRPVHDRPYACAGMMVLRITDRILEIGIINALGKGFHLFCNLFTRDKSPVPVISLRCFLNLCIRKQRLNVTGKPRANNHVIRIIPVLNDRKKPFVGKYPHAHIIAHFGMIRGNFLWT